MTDQSALGGVPAAADPTSSLILDFLESLGPQGRPYAEVMEAWRTSCPRLTVWEDAVDQGWVRRERSGPAEAVVALTPMGREHLRRSGRALGA
ncbi:hypothetical protein [Phenylobacterium sp.]|uniref:hypothetical protein n=1 Tax=Phenylobacterium sp. TaxID=1871053 RepID=UPI002D1788A3|nr:hypothetical protein [Phenylobacterium sp.]HLZ75051.1 hypothetical protein [Phenylobacterium sp.]